MDPVLIPVSEVVLVDTPDGRRIAGSAGPGAAVGAGGTHRRVMLIPAGGVSPVTLEVQSLREHLAPVLDIQLGDSELVAEINGWIEDELFLALGPGGWSLGLQRRGGAVDAVDLDSRAAPRVSTTDTSVTLEHRDSSVAARVTDVSADGGGCALECDGAALQALLANNMFRITPANEMPGGQRPPAVEIEVRSVTRTGGRFRVGCEVKRGHGPVKKLAS